MLTGDKVREHRLSAAWFVVIWTTLAHTGQGTTDLRQDYAADRPTLAGMGISDIVAARVRQLTQDISEPRLPLVSMRYSSTMPFLLPSLVDQIALELFNPSKGYVVIDGVLGERAAAHMLEEVGVPTMLQPTCWKRSVCRPALFKPIGRMIMVWEGHLRELRPSRQVLLCCICPRVGGLGWGTTSRSAFGVGATDLLVALGGCTPGNCTSSR